MTRAMTAVVALAWLSGAAVADDRKQPSAPSNPQFEKMKTLVGTWEGAAHEGGKGMPAKTSFRVVSAGSVLMNILGEGTPHEMVTMFHLDLKDLLATHYCAAQNQPRLKATAGGKPNEIRFEFKDGTNIGPHDGHMHRVVFTFVDADHHFEDWTYLQDGKEMTNRFDFHRKK